MRGERNRLWAALILLMLLFIWGNSLIPPETSWRISNAVQHFLALFTPVDAPAGSGGGIWGTVVRKLAHFTEFCVLGTLLRARWQGARQETSLPLLLGLLTAVTDESIQAFTGRTSSVFDVWIDFAGVTAGVVLMAGIACWVEGRRSIFNR